MNSPHDTLARLLRVTPAILAELERRMNAISGQEGVLEDIVRQIDAGVDTTLVRLGLTRADSAATVRGALVKELTNLDRHLFQILGEPDLSQLSQRCGKLCETALKLFTPPKGLFLKREKVAGMLEKHPPQNILDHFGYATVAELLEREGFASVMAALRFTQTTEWMHQFFETAYSDVTLDDFEERDVELMVLDVKWLKVAEKFIAHKHHNVSHLKEFGVIFIAPIPLDLPGETLRMFTLVLHYLHEVPFYAALFRRHLRDANFASVFKSLLRGDVSKEETRDTNTTSVIVRIVQRYLAKDDADDFRLLEPHVNPEATHWLLAQEDMRRLSRILGHDAGGFDLSWWVGLDFVGSVFTDAATGQEQLLSFDLIDLIMSLAQKEERIYVYHQQEALWNRIFIEYLGRERMDELVQQNLLSGFITLP